MPPVDTGAPSVVITLSDGRTARALRHVYDVTSDEVAKVIGVSGRTIRAWEARTKLEPRLAEKLRNGIEAAVVARVTDEQRSS